MRGKPSIKVRLDQSWIDQLKLLASRQGISLSQLVREIIYAYLGGE